jgi:hypothetical protein
MTPAHLIILTLLLVFSYGLGFKTNDHHSDLDTQTLTLVASILFFIFNIAMFFVSFIEVLSPYFR